MRMRVKGITPGGGDAKHLVKHRTPNNRPDGREADASVGQTQAGRMMVAKTQLR